MLKQIEANIDVLTAARQRIINLFSNGAKVYLSFSGGKDSIVLADITYKLIQEGRIDKSLLTVSFIDEEGMYDEVIDIVKDWRRKWMLIGVKFEWYCLETKHFNCLNQLTNDETFITWDRYEKDNWIRPMPPFAITDHPLLNKRIDSYQQFMERMTTDGFQMVGVRTAESVQRLINMSHINQNNVSAGRKFFPIYDWKDSDIWYYLYTNRCDIPITYLQMWQVGVSKRNMRISQFFSIDTVRSLVRMSEFCPDLMNRVEKRQPNAYIACLYWDSEMFARSSRTRRKIETKKDEEENVDYRRKYINYLYDDKNFETENQKKVQNWYKNRTIGIIKLDVSQDDWRKLYEALKGGDVKLRSGRAITRQIKGKYYSEAGKEN